MDEANFFFTLSEFQQLVKEYGVEEVMDNLDDETYMALFDFVMPPIEDDDGGEQSDD